MAFGRFLITVLILGCVFESLASASTDSSATCYRIEPTTIAGVIGADVLLTLIIVAITYRFASSRQKRIKTADNIYMNTRAKSNKNNKRLQKRYQTVE